MIADCWYRGKMQRDNRDRKNENKGTSLLGIAAGTLLAGAALGVAAYLGFELYKKWTKEELELVPVFQVDKRLAGLTLVSITTT